MHHNSGNGIFIGSKSAGGHLVLNCDAHDNYDATSNQGQGQNADGFGVHYQTKGDTTIIRGCRAWWNSDDGYDLINQEIPVTVENSWAMGNGYADYGNTNPTDGNGNGFKMGSSKTGIRHLVQNNAPVSGGTSVGGMSATGGRTGTSGTGGAAGVGGTIGSGGSSAETGGSVAPGGAVGSGGSVATGGTSGTSTGQGNASSGCSCRLARAQTTSLPAFAILALPMFAVRLRKRR